MSLAMRAALGACLLTVGGFSAPASAQALKEGDLVNIKGLTCTFPVATRMVWKDGVPEPAVTKTEALTVEITDIEAADGSAVIGNDDVNVQVYGWNIHFLQILDAGRIAVTTVFAQYSTGMKLKAVHSRTDYTSPAAGEKAEPQVTQYYGDCVAER